MGDKADCWGQLGRWTGSLQPLTGWGCFLPVKLFEQFNLGLKRISQPAAFPPKPPLPAHVLLKANHFCLCCCSVIFDIAGSLPSANLTIGLYFFYISVQLINVERESFWPKKRAICKAAWEPLHRQMQSHLKSLFGL